MVSKRWFDGCRPRSSRTCWCKEARALHKDMLEFARKANRKAQETWKTGSKDGWIELTAAAEGRVPRRASSGIDAKIVQEFPQVKEMLDLVRRKANELR